MQLTDQIKNLKSNFKRKNDIWNYVMHGSSAGDVIAGDAELYYDIISG